MNKYPVPSTQCPVQKGRWQTQVGVWLLAFFVCVLSTGYCFIAPAVEIASGSMAPAFLGPHRCTTCPHCGAPVRIGLHPRDRGPGEADPKWYHRAWCGNCGRGELNIHAAPVKPGERLRMLKPNELNPVERWDVAVFQWDQDWAVKRVVGLPGEHVSIKNGDLWINDRLYRKSPQEILALRQLVFDSAQPPPASVWRARWHGQPAKCVSFEPGGKLRINAVGGKCSLLYGNRQDQNEQWLPFCDEYSYNSAQAAPTTPVHDFLVELEFEILRGGGEFRLTLTDGAAVGFMAVDWSANEPGRRSCRVGTGVATENPLKDGLTPIPNRDRKWEPEKTHIHDGESRQHYNDWTHNPRMARRQKMRLALVDQQVTAWYFMDHAITYGLVPGQKRRSVVWPFEIRVEGAEVLIHHLRLYRDIHYTGSGRNGVGGKVVRLGADEYFVLGDNSPLARDSRHWPGGGILHRREIVGVLVKP